MNLKVRLALMNFLQFAVWGAYLTCMGIYLSSIGMASHIGPFFAMQGIVSIFMPALMGIVADRWIPAQRLLGFCHLAAGLFMFAAAWYGHSTGTNAAPVELGGLQCAGATEYGHRERLSSHSRVWHRRFHLFHVVCRPDGVQVDGDAIRGEWRVKHSAFSLHVHLARLSHFARRREEEPGRCIGTACFHAVPPEEDGHFLCLFHATGRESTDN